MVDNVPGNPGASHQEMWSPWAGARALHGIWAPLAWRGPPRRDLPSGRGACRYEVPAMPLACDFSGKILAVI